MAGPARGNSEAMRQGDDVEFPENGIGARLKKAREEKGLDIAQVGRELRMPARVVASLEAEDWARLGAPVFVRGQLRSYARLLGLPVDEIVRMPDLTPVAVAELKPRTYVPPMRRFAEQASRKGVYILLTLVFLVPLWSAMQQRSPVEAGSNTTPLDGASAGAVDQGSKPAQRPRAAMRASMTPLPARPSEPALSLRFEGDSWVEVVSADGTTIESGIIAGGEVRNYDPGEVARVKLGNAGGVSVLHEGDVQDLTPYLRANVARFTVSSDGSLLPPVD